MFDEVRELRRKNLELEKSEIEHKRLAGLVIRAKKEWGYIFDFLPDLIALIDRQHRIVRVNKAMANRLGLAISKRFVELMGDGIWQEWSRNIGTQF